MMMERLLVDMTTGVHIIKPDGSQMRVEDTVCIQPRCVKEKAEQQTRTKKKAEVFTPSWLCCRMVNDIDEVWFGRKDVFNLMYGHTWVPTDGHIAFDGEKTWRDYVMSTRLEITCGEAPYVVSRYDTVTGESIPINRRIGMLDRKLRVVTENTDNEADWLRWSEKALQSVYGYEYQADNLMLARVNVLLTYCEYMDAAIGREPTEKELLFVANIICWNFWQMDGLSDKIPGTDTYCRICDWRAGQAIEFRSLKDGGNG